MALCRPACPLGVWLGWRLLERLDQRQLYRTCYALLTATALKLCCGTGCARTTFSNRP